MRIIGHRGARKEAPENTVQSFMHAQSNGCTAFELDIQLSRDNELVVFHDTTLHRTTGSKGPLATRKFEELNKLDASYGFVKRTEHSPVPLLQEVIDASPHCEDWQFEVKPESWLKCRIIAQQIGKLIINQRLYDEARCTVTSSSKRFISIFKQLYPGLNTGLVVESDSQGAVSESVRLGVDILVINRKLVTKDLCMSAQEAGLEVSVWTVNSLDEMERLRETGVDSIITDLPTMAIRHFA